MEIIAGTALEYVTYHVTYFRDLRIYIRSLSEKEDIQGVYYGMIIPVEYQSEPLKKVSGTNIMRAVKPLILFGIGGFIYIAIELLWRGHTHWTMFLVGGICFLLVGYINEIFTFDMPLIKQMAISAIIITTVEFLAGLLVNRTYSIWDYHDLPLNILGQICLPYSILWFLLSLPAIILDDYLRYWLFGEEKTHYKLL